MTQYTNSAATKFHPYLVYLLGFEVALLGLALAFGAYLLLRHFLKKRPFDGNPAVENKEIARQIQEEIQRLVELRNRIDPALATLESGKIAAQVGPAVAPATSGDTKAIEEKYQGEIKSLTEKITGLEAALKAAQEAAAKGAATPADGQAAAAPASSEEIQKIKDEAAQSKTELEQQVVHLETVVSEYRIFEEDFAMVKKYKGENDQLREEIAQLKAKMEGMAANPAPVAPAAPVAAPAQTAVAPAPVNPELSEQDITNLFQSFDLPTDSPPPPAQPAQASVPAPAPQEELDPIAALAAQPDPAPLAELAAAPAAPAPIEVAPSAPPDANEIEAFFKAQDAATGKSVDEADALLAELHAAAANSGEPAPAAETTNPPKPGEGYEIERVKQEPDVSLAEVAKNESLEDLAESAAGDDKLMEEFQKVLESEKAG